MLSNQRTIECFEDNGDKVMTIGTFDLFESLNIIVLGAVGDAQYLCDKFRIISCPIARGAGIMGFHSATSLS